MFTMALLDEGYLEMYIAPPSLPAVLFSKVEFETVKLGKAEYTVPLPVALLLTKVELLIDAVYVFPEYSGDKYAALPSFAEQFSKYAFVISRLPRAYTAPPTFEEQL